MSGRKNTNALDDTTTNTGDEDDAMSPAIPKAVLAVFLAALTGTITTVVSTAVSAVQLVSTPRYSKAIDLFNIKLIDLTSGDGRGQWYNTTEKTGGWK